MKPNTTVLKLDGTLTASPAETEARWVEHYAAVYRGQVVGDAQLVTKPRPDLPHVTMDVGPVATERSFALLKNKGVGLDDIPSELLKAGDSPLAIHYSGVNQRVVNNATWPVSWRGGSFTNVFKKKGNPQVCDNHRSILLADRVGKVLVGRIKDLFEPTYITRMPACQHGAVPGKGTDLASHLVLSAAAAAAMLNLSKYILFVDLVKAFDKVVRQIVYGWGPSPLEDKAAYLLGSGVFPSSARWIVQCLEERGHLLQPWSADPTASALAESFHRGAWFKVNGSQVSITSNTGGGKDAN